MKLFGLLLAGAANANGNADCPAFDSDRNGLLAKYNWIKTTEPYASCFRADDNECNLRCNSRNVDAFPYGKEEHPKWRNFGCTKRKWACFTSENWIAACCAKHSAEEKEEAQVEDQDEEKAEEEQETASVKSLHNSPEVPSFRPLMSGPNLDQDRQLRGNQKPKSGSNPTRHNLRDPSKKKRNNRRRNRNKPEVYSFSKPGSMSSQGLGRQGSNMMNPLANPYGRFTFPPAAQQQVSQAPLNFNSGPSFRVQTSAAAANSGFPGGRMLPIGFARSMPVQTGRMHKSKSQRVGQDNKDYRALARAITNYQETGVHEASERKQKFQVLRKARKARCYLDACHSCNLNIDQVDDTSNGRSKRSFFGIGEKSGARKCADMKGLISENQVGFKTKEFKDYQEAADFPDCWQCVKETMGATQGCQSFKH